jgi:hypothetical protein
VQPPEYTLAGLIFSNIHSQAEPLEIGSWSVMPTKTEWKSTEKSKLQKIDEKQALFKAEFAELWRNAQRRRSTYVGLLIAQIFRQSSRWIKSSDNIKATPPSRQVTSP